MANHPACRRNDGVIFVKTRSQPTQRPCRSCKARDGADRQLQPVVGRRCGPLVSIKLEVQVRLGLAPSGELERIVDMCVDG